MNGRASTFRRSARSPLRAVHLRRRARGVVVMFGVGGTCVALSCARTDEPHPIADASVLDADSVLDASELDAPAVESD